MRISRTKAGFTLAEMVVVLAVMSVLLSMSVAAFNSMLQSKGVEGAVKTVVGALSTARIKAMNDRREVTCGINVDGAIEYGFCVMYGSNQNSRTRVINRMMRRGETVADIAFNKSVQKNWPGGTYTPYGNKLFWAFIVGGKGAGHNPVEITRTSMGWMLEVKGWDSGGIPGNNSLLCILEGTKGGPPPDVTKLRYMISSDVTGGTWELLPESVDIDGTYFPITFAPDGSATFPYDHAVIRLRDLRSSARALNVDKPRWGWRIVVARGSGRCTTSEILPGDIDEVCDREF